MREILLKDTLRSVARNKLRFLSVVIIVALGISFYIGIKSASPKMDSTANSYFNEYNLLDLRVASRIPFSDDDIKKISKLDNVDSVIKSRYVDAIVRVGNTVVVDNNGMEMSVRVSEFDAVKAKGFTMQGEQDATYVNRLKLVSGRYPEKTNECVIDSAAVKLYDNIKIGTVLTLTGDGASVADRLTTEEFKIVGTVDSPMYISADRGTTQVGSGSLSAFIYVDSQSFSTDEYNELFVKVTGSQDMNKFGALYDETVSSIADEIKDMSHDIIASKLVSVKAEYNAKITAKEQEIKAYNESSAKQLESKQKEIDELKAYVDSEDTILENEKKNTEKNKTSAKSSLESLNSSFNTLNASYEENVKKYDLSSGKIDGYSELKKLYDDLSQKHSADKKNLDMLEQKKNDEASRLDVAKISDDKASYALSRAEDKISTLNSDISRLEKDIQALESDKVAQLSKIESADREIAELQQKIDTLTEKQNNGTITTYESINLRTYKSTISLRKSERSEAQNKIGENEAQITSKRSSIVRKTDELKTADSELTTLKSAQAQTQSSLSIAQTNYNNAKSNYDGAKKSYDSDTATLNKYKSSMDSLTSGKGEISTLKRTVDSQRAQLNTLKVSLTVAQIRYSLALRNGDRKVLEAQNQLDIANERYRGMDEAFETLKNEIALKKSNLNGDLKTLKNTLKNIESITWTATAQTSLGGHKSFISSMENIDSMSTIFPLIFLFTAMVACFVIMLKNVEDERNAIGLFKAFGYSELTVIGKYITYSTAAWILGSLIGIVMGIFFFPRAIYSIYGSIYNIPDINIAFNLKYILRGMSASFITTTAASCIAAIKELRLYPAVLMRPKTISYNRHSPVESIPGLWERMPYGMILLVRTLSRSRKRVVVGTLAIGCCTALILSALGLLNSSADVKSAQYGKDGIFCYDMQLVLNAGQEPDDSVTLEKLNKNRNVVSSMLISNQSFDVASVPSRWKGLDSAHIIVPSDVKSMKKYLNVDLIDGTDKIEKGGALISEKMSEDLNLEVGSEIYFFNADNDMFKSRVTGIVKNYIDHYVYMSPEAYSETFLTAPSYKYIVTVLKDFLTENEIALFSSEYLKTDEVTGITSAENLANSVDISINQVLALVIMFVAAACILAAIVLYTISNVNISERTHEIANIKVLGFSDGEVLLYVVRENIVSTVIGAVLGLIGGKLLHTALVNYISVENVLYGTHLSIWSFFVAILIIAAVAGATALPTMLKIRRVNMPETLKFIE